MRAFSYAARAQSRAIIVDSETDGTPAMPRRAAASPSCMTPFPGEVGILFVERDLEAGKRLVLQGAAHDAGASDQQAIGDVVVLRSAYTRALAVGAGDDGDGVGRLGHAQ